MSTKSSAEKSQDGVIRSLSPQKMARLLDKSEFITQVLRSEDGKPAVRFLKLGVDGMALFFRAIDNDHYGIVVLNTIFPGTMPAERVNELNSRGVLPKIYIANGDTVIELCIPLEAGLTDETVAYYIQAFELLLKNL